MIEMAAQVFAMVFIGTILVCLVWTIGSYIAEAYSPNNKLKENMKKMDKKYK